MTLHLKEISKSLASSVAPSDFCLTRNTECYRSWGSRLGTKTSSAALEVLTVARHTRAHARTYTHVCAAAVRETCGNKRRVIFSERVERSEESADQSCAIMVGVDLRLSSDHFEWVCSSYLRVSLWVPVQMRCRVSGEVARRLTWKNHSHKKKQKKKQQRYFFFLPLFCFFFLGRTWRENRGNFFMDSFSPSVCEMAAAGGECTYRSKEFHFSNTVIF